MNKTNLLLICCISMLLLSCSDGSEKKSISDSLSNSLSFNEKLRFLIVYSDETSIPSATRQVARTLGCTKSSISRVLNGEMQPTPLMQMEVDNAFRAALKKKSLKKLDRTLNFWQRNIAFWYNPDTTDIYLNTINPLYEEIP